MTRAGRRREPSSFALDERKMQALTELARRVIEGQESLLESWRECANAQQLRGLDLRWLRDHGAPMLCEHALQFGGSAYQERLLAVRSALATVQTICADLPLRVLGPPAEGLAADDDLLEVAVFADEPEALLRRLQDLQIRYQLDQQRWSIRANGPPEIHPAVVLGTDGADCRISILPLRWRHQQLYQTGECVWSRQVAAR